MAETPSAARRTQLITIPEVAKRLACSRGHVYNLIAAGALSSVEIKATGTRSKTRVLEHELLSFIEAHTATPLGKEIPKIS